jgi:hypothetical protein
MDSYTIMLIRSPDYWTAVSVYASHLIIRRPHFLAAKICCSLPNFHGTFHLFGWLAIRYTLRLSSNFFAKIW